MKVRHLAWLGVLFATAAYAADPAQDNAPAAAAPEASAPAAQAQTTPEATAAKPSGSVARASFSSAIENREPTDTLSSLTNDTSKIYYFTELRDLAGQTITHRWEYNGKVMAEVPFKVGGDRWRVYSSKNLNADWTGEWKASVITSDGSALSVNTFTYSTAAAEPAADSQPAPATPAETAPSGMQ